NTGGEKVFPEEVEAVLHDHPAVYDAIVVGVPDERWGERVTAVVAPSGNAPTEDDLIAHCRAQLAGFQVPRQVGFVDQVQRSLVLVSALSRIGAVQNPMLPIYRQREVGFITHQARSKLLIIPGTWRGFDFEEMALAIASGQPSLEVLVAHRALPQGDPTQLPPPPPCPATDDGL